MSEDANNNRKDTEEIRNYELKIKQMNDVKSEMDSKIREMVSLQQKMSSLMKS